MKKKKTPSPIKKKSPAKRKAATATAGKKKPSVSKAKGKLTKQAESEALKAHDLYWKSYLVGDIETLASLLDDHYTQIGSVENEVFFNKKDAVKFVQQTIDQVAGNVEMRNRVTKAELVDGFVLLHEQCDLYVQIEGVWTFYSKFRASSLMQKTETGWKMVHQHSSLPDSKAQEGENIALEKVAAENLQLRDAVKRRTVELEQKNRELEIEAALERVRALTMAMHNSEDVSKCIVKMFGELTALGVDEGTRFGIGILNHGNENIQLWTARKDGEEVNMHVGNLDMSWHPLLKSVRKAWKEKVQLHKYVLEGEDLLNYYRMLNNSPDYKIHIPLEKLPQREFHYGFVFEHGFFYAFSHLEFQSELINITQRFSLQFGQTYRRFLDLKKAEAQAREAQIEAALERVRSRTMAMHRSEELTEVASMLFRQIKDLGIKAWTTGFNIWAEDNNSYVDYVTDPEGNFIEPYKVDTTLAPVLKGVREARKAGQEFFVNYEEGEAIKETYRFLMSFGEKGQYEKLLESGYQFPTQQYEHFVFGKKVSLMFITYEPVLEAHDIFKRFGKVFEQTYTRFLDLQKAEAQVREAKIEAALEKVRSRSLAMHKSDELKEVVVDVFEKLKELGLTFDVTGIQLYTEGSKDIVQWVAALDLLSAPVLAKLPYSEIDFNECEIIHDIWTAKEKGKSFQNKNYSFEDKNRFFEYAGRHNDNSAIPAAVREFQLKAPGYTQSLVAEKHSALWVDSYQGQTISADEFSVLGRFARVFEQAYVRFLDLQKAEAQAREAQIEAALERVRSRSMGMQRVDDMRSVIKEVYEQLKFLGFKSGVAAINIMDETTVDMDVWMDGLEDGYELPERYHVPYFDHPGHNQHLQHWKNGDPYAVIEMSGPEKKSYDNYFFYHTDFARVPEPTKNLMMSQKSLISSMAYMKYGAIGWAPSVLNIEQAAVLQRFAKVFEQTYTRFLDLQKAETQAREAQIEAALEKIRSRSLAMHHSGELRDVIAVFFEKLIELGTLLGTVGIGLYDQKSKDISCWVGNAIQDPQLVVAPFDEAIMKEENFISQSWKAMTEKTELVNVVYSREQKDRYFNHLFAHNDLVQIPESAREILRKMEKHTVCFIPNHYSSLFVDSWDGKQYSDEDITILRRAGKVFEQAYIRFLDLQKAEAQAREAEIQLALERARARTMAMQRSEDLKEVVKVMYEQLRGLGFQWGAAAIIIMDSATGDLDWWMEGFAHGYELPECYHVPYFEHQGHKQQLEHWKNGSAFAVIEVSGKEKKAYDQYYFNQTDFANAPENTKQLMMQQETVLFSMAYMKYGALSWSPTPLSNEQSKILQRFAQVFEQTYTRFLDLQKAEAQAREAQIEACLERVRASTMAMHQSLQILEVIKVLCDQIMALGFPIHSSNIATNFSGGDYNMWIYSLGAPVYPKQVLIKSIGDFFPDFVEAFNQGKELFTITLSKDEKDRFYQHLLTETILKDLVPDDRKEYLFNAVGYAQTFAFQKHTILSILNYDGVPYSNEQNQILKRFAFAFEQSYVRFLDLQKAEAQAREAQIEAALERIRSSAMAMHSSEGILDVTQVLREQIAMLGEKELESILVHIYHEDTDQFEAWYSYRHPENTEKQIRNGKQLLSWSHTARARKDKEKYHEEASDYTLVADYNMLKEWYEYLLEVIPEVVEINAEGQPLVPEVLYYNYSKITGGALLLITNSEASDHSKYLLRRAAIVFNLAYSRFLDLQKAEAQARESQIQLALERVRAKTMAMQSSNDLLGVANVLREQMGSLAQPELESSIVHLYNDTSPLLEAWYAFRPPNLVSREIITGVGIVPKDCSAWSREVMAKYNSAETEYTIVASGEKLIEWYKILEQYASPTIDYDEKGQLVVPEILYYHFSKFSGGALLMISNQAPSAEARELQKRAAVVFDLAYTRFLDLKKAEAQAREAQIEAALERVRGKAMAMHSSEDLTATISAFYHELELFSITPRRCGVGLLDKETHMAELSTMNTTEQGESIEVIGRIKMVGHPVLESVFDNWLKQKEYHPVLHGNEIKEYYQLIRPQVAFPEYPKDVVQYGYFFFFDEGGVYAWTEKELTEEELKIYRRFTSVLSLTYKRYKDLRDAEAREQGAIKQAALDRVRADIASMRNTADLDRITPLIWKELTTLGIPFIRCGVFIMDDHENKVHTYLSTPDGHAIAAYHISMDDSGNLAGAIDHWRKEKVFVTHWDNSDFQIQADILLKQGSITSREQYLNSIPKEGFHLHFLPFRQGMLYVGSNEQLQADALQLVQSLADAFSVAYARYEDFTKLESAKQQIENALVDLKQTQAQLVQSEKMASLGELTAGIAHEIQNPLNFVNNFSEVSTELVDEMNEELLKGNTEDAKLIAIDLKQNLEKINHHGKRAGDIVKGMLQHSRSSSGVKEPTDINALADEYLRLAYHGLRAKDKSFNAKFEMHPDPDLPKVNVLPQDVGRVILNLINNAFYAVTQKLKSESLEQKAESQAYEPTVTVTTKNLGDSIEIRIRDNGTGIPEKVKEKIFQPFFTTKPTGQGTGLGLSLSYDIITKGHGGEIKMETKEGEGTEFTIVLPIL